MSKSRLSKIKLLIRIKFLRQKLLTLSVVIIGLSIGLVKAGSEIQMLWCWIGVVGVVVVVGLVRFFVLKFRILWLWIAIVDFLVIILGQLAGLGLASILVSVGYKNVILLGIMIGWIGVMMGWYAVLKERLIGMASVGVAILGIIFSNLLGDELTTAVTSGLVSVSSGLGSVSTQLDSGLGSVSTQLDSGLGSVSTQLDSGLGSVSTQLDSGLGSVSTKLDSGLGSVSTKLDSGLGSVSTKLDSGLGSVSTQLDSGLGSVSTKLDSGLGSVSTKLDSGLGSVSTKLDSGLENLAAQIVGQIKNYQSDPNSQIVKALESQIGSLTTTLKSQETTIDSIKEELDKAEKAQNSVRLLVGTEQNLIAYCFLITKNRFIFKKSYRLSQKLSADTSLVAILPIDSSFALESAPKKLIGGSGSIKLKRLVSHTGTLENNKDYVKNDGTTSKIDSTFITFTNPFLGGMHILAVVERGQK